MSVTADNFYRRPLPDTCVDFASEEGKRLFRESLLEGNAELYFKLASQFLTQDEPAYCGLSTLVMVLNALEVDPERIWKAPWRFYHESMLDCCVPLESVKRTGINLSQFNCLAVCNRLETRIEYGDYSPEFLTALREEVISCVRGEATVLVASYDRAQLEQTGTGHFSPLAAYHAATDRVLILDVARFKYPPHWVSLPLLQKAMCTIDTSCMKPRGYVSMKLGGHSRPLVIFGLKCNLGENDEDFATSVLSWHGFLLDDRLLNEEEELSLCCRRFAECFAPHAICCTQEKHQEDVEKNSNQCSVMHSKACSCVWEEVRRTKVGCVLQDAAVAALMLAWPFERDVSDRSNTLDDIMNEEYSGFSTDTKNEISVLRTQLTTLISCSRPASRLERIQSISSQKKAKNCVCTCKKNLKS